MTDLQIQVTGYPTFEISSIRDAGKVWKVQVKYQGRTWHLTSKGAKDLGTALTSIGYQTGERNCQELGR